jgi:hypothetical protein
LRRIEEAQCMGESMESILFDDVRCEESEVYGDASPIPDQTPSAAPAKADRPAQPAAKRSAGATILLVIIVAILGSALGYLFFTQIIRMLE